MKKKLSITPEVLGAIAKDIGTKAPERGGFLFGNISHLQISHFLYDSEGRTSDAHYFPSRNSPANIAMVEREKNVKMLGVIHSHPAFLDRPSGPDLAAIQSLLDLNPSLPYVISPIVTHRKKEKPHEFQLPHAKISFFITSRREGGPFPLGFSVDHIFLGAPTFTGRHNPLMVKTPSPTPAQQLHQELPSSPRTTSLNEKIAQIVQQEIEKHISELKLHLLQRHVQLAYEPSKAESEHEIPILAYNLHFCEITLVCLFSFQYPLFPPYVTMRQGNDSVNFMLPWKSPAKAENSAPSKDILWKAFQNILFLAHRSPPPPLLVFYGSPGNYTSDTLQAKKKGYHPFLSNCY